MHVSFIKNRTEHDELSLKQCQVQNNLMILYSVCHFHHVHALVITV